MRDICTPVDRCCFFHHVAVLTLNSGTVHGLISQQTQAPFGSACWWQRRWGLCASPQQRPQLPGKWTSDEWSLEAGKKTCKNMGKSWNISVFYWYSTGQTWWVFMRFMMDYDGLWLICRFPEIGLPPVLIRLSGIFPEINHPAIGRSPF